MNAVTDTTISIAICTYNRAAELRKTLDSLRLVSDELLPGDEIIVVNNNSVDQTNGVIHEFDEYLPIRAVNEGEQGLSAARNCALRLFKADAIIFFDDDVTVSAGCLTAYRSKIFSNTRASFFGGRIDVDWQGNTPDWYSDERLPMIDGLIGRYELGGGEVFYPPEDHLPFGANFALHRSLIERVGFFDANLGVKGSGIGRGEESDYFQRAIASGFTGCYLFDALVAHRFQTERISIAYLFRYGIEKGRALEPNTSNKPWLVSASAQMLRGFFQLLKGRRDRLYQCVINMGVAKGAAEDKS